MCAKSRDSAIVIPRLVMDLGSGQSIRSWRVVKYCYEDRLKSEQPDIPRQDNFDERRPCRRQLVTMKRFDHVTLITFPVLYCPSKHCYFYLNVALGKRSEAGLREVPWF